VPTLLLVAADSVRSLLHQRLLLGLMLASLAVTAIFSTLLIKERAARRQQFTAEAVANSPTGAAKLSKEDQQKLAEQMGQMASIFEAGFYQVASFGGSLVALFIFSTAVATEIRRGTIRITMTKPVSRSQYLLGKYLGGVAVMAGYALISGAAIALFGKFGGVQLSPAIKYAPWLMFCRQLMLGSLAMLLSLYLHPFLGAVLAFLAGNGLYSPHDPLFYIFPSYSVFNVFGQVLQGTLLNGKDIVLLTLYAGDFVIVMLLLALWRFRTKEIV